MKLAIFDLDETLIKGDASSLFCQFLADKGHVSPDFLATEQALMAQYAAQTLAMEDYIAFLVAPVNTLQPAVLQQWLAEFVSRRIRPRIYPAARQLLQQLHDDGYTLLIISASADFIVRAIAKDLGIQHLAIDLEQSPEGTYTGRIQGIATYQAGKVLRLEQWLKEHRYHPSETRFYSDSMNDLPLLEQVSCASVVNPDTSLSALAQQRNWPQLTWTLSSSTAPETNP